MVTTGIPARYRQTPGVSNPNTSQQPTRQAAPSNNVVNTKGVGGTNMQTEVLKKETPTVAQQTAKYGGTQAVFSGRYTPEGKPIYVPAHTVSSERFTAEKAKQAAGNTEIEVVIEKTTSENDVYLRAIETNASHGLQLSMKDKQSVAVKLYDLKNRQRLIKCLSISERTFDSWVSNKAKQLKEQIEDKAIQLYLHAELTQQEVADKIGVSRTQITEIVINRKNAVNDKITDFSPFLYNIWNVVIFSVFLKKHLLIV